MAVDVVYVFKQ